MTLDVESDVKPHLFLHSFILQNAEVSKQLATEKQKQDEEGASSKGLEEELSRLREERSAMQESMQQSSSSVAEQLAIAASGKMVIWNFFLSSLFLPSRD